ncbi:hypothetical protein Vadar_029699 [Vaccinium darrowii]|uniref:Uncharacterized protein n=1 Tax=Vaccinium darrowii TaxID=229202 RepID=A0ACB7Y3Y3_9ERIC|nr:hypothetical protein Vadar_029699 [Vaccinium darrowii]
MGRALAGPRGLEWRSRSTFVFSETLSCSHPNSSSQLWSFRGYSVKNTKAVVTKAKKGKSKSDSKSDTSSSAVSAAADSSTTRTSAYAASPRTRTTVPSTWGPMDAPSSPPLLHSLRSPVQTPVLT